MQGTLLPSTHFNIGFRSIYNVLSRVTNFICHSAYGIEENRVVVKNKKKILNIYYHENVIEASGSLIVKFWKVEQLVSASLVRRHVEVFVELHFHRQFS